jgi:hypothetical protein
MLGSRDSSVSAVNRLRAGFDSRKGKIFSSLQRPDQLWGHPASYLVGTGVLFSEVKRPEREDNNAAP